MDPWATVLLAAGVGFFSGVLSALAGVGGAVITTPGIRALGATPLEAVGSTVPAIIPSAITGSIRYSRAGLIDWRVGRWCGFSGMLSAFAGALVADQIGGQWLMIATALLVLWSSSSVLRSARSTTTTVDAPAAPRTPPDSALPVLIALGIGAGFVAGILGVGGGIILVPAFTTLLKLPVRQTVATSLVAVALMSVASLAGHLSTGNIDWALALPLVIGVVPGAWVGSKITVQSSEHTMSLVVGSILGVIGVIYLIRETVILFG
jgi:uncharacterized membrane protein YfcA